MLGAGLWRVRNAAAQMVSPSCRARPNLPLGTQPDPVLPVPSGPRPKAFRIVYSEITRAVTRGSLADLRGEEHDE